MNGGAGIAGTPGIIGRNVGGQGRVGAFGVVRPGWDALSPNPPGVFGGAEIRRPGHEVDRAPAPNRHHRQRPDAPGPSRHGPSRSSGLAAGTAAERRGAGVPGHGATEFGPRFRAADRRPVAAGLRPTASRHFIQGFAGDLAHGFVPVAGGPRSAALALVPIAARLSPPLRGRLRNRRRATAPRSESPGRLCGPASPSSRPTSTNIPT